MCSTKAAGRETNQHQDLLSCVSNKADLLQGDDEDAVGAAGPLVHSRRRRHSVLGARGHHRDQLLRQNTNIKTTTFSGFPGCNGRVACRVSYMPVLYLVGSRNHTAAVLCMNGACAGKMRNMRRPNSENCWGYCTEIKRNKCGGKITWGTAEDSTAVW